MCTGALVIKVWPIISQNIFAGVFQKNAQDLHPRRQTTNKSERNSRFRIARVC
jgi:hypothetical protein